MTQRMRVSSYSPETTGSSVSETPRHKHRRKIPGHPKESISKWPQQDPDEEEEEESEDEEFTNNDATYAESDTVTNTPRNGFSSPESDSVSIAETSVVEAATSVNSTSYSPTAYINIAPLPIFRGSPGECPVTHLSRFMKVCRANNASAIDMIMRIFPVTLDNEAALWYDINIEPCPSLTWEEIKSSFIQVYHRTESVDQFRSELMMLRQGENESVNAYFLRMQWILKRWPDHGIPDGLLKGIFIDGLREDFQDWIVPQKPNSLNEAQRLALTWEQSQFIRAARHKKYMKCGFCDGLHEEQTCKIRERMRELWLKSEEKKLTVSSQETTVRDAVPMKAFFRSLSAALTSSDIRHQGEEEDKEEGLLSWNKKSQCQCWKHQCWKKKMERNNGLVARNSTAD